MKTYVFPEAYTRPLEDETEIFRIMFMRNNCLFLTRDEDEGVTVALISDLDKKRVLKEQTWELMDDKELNEALDATITEFNENT